MIIIRYFSWNFFLSSDQNSMLNIRNSFCHIEANKLWKKFGMVNFSQQHAVHLRAKQVRIALTRRSWMMVRWLWRFDIMVSWGGSARLVLPSKKTPPCWFRLIHYIYIDMHDIDIHRWVLVKLCNTKIAVGKMFIFFHRKIQHFHSWSIF